MLLLTKTFLRRLALLLAAAAAAAKLGTAVAMFFSLALSVAAYALPFGIAYAAGLVALLLAHEAGHVIAARAAGIRASLPVFIPFLGAVVRLRRAPVNAKMAADIALGGPALGTLSALACIAAHLWTDSALLLALAYTACVFNLFNLLPCEPLDGAVIGEAISPHLWRFGSVLLAGLFFCTYNLVLFLILLVSLRRLWGGRSEAAHYYRLASRQRAKVLGWYLGLTGVLAAAAYYSGTLLL